MRLGNLQAAKLNPDWTCHTGLSAENLMSGLKLREIIDFGGSETVWWSDTVAQAHHIVAAHQRWEPSQKSKYFHYITKVGEIALRNQWDWCILIAFLFCCFNFWKCLMIVRSLKAVLDQKIILNSNNVPSLFLSCLSLTHSETLPFIHTFFARFEDIEGQPLPISLVFFLYFEFPPFFTVLVLSLFMAWLNVAKDMVCYSCWFPQSEECDPW